MHDTLSSGVSSSCDGANSFLFVVLSGPAVAKKSELWLGRRSFVAGERLVAKLTLRDNYANLVSDPARAASTKIEVMLYHGVSTDSMRIDSSAPMSGIFEYSYILGHQGGYSLVATVDDVIVGDEPIHMYVSPGTVSESLSTVDCPHVVSGLVGQQARLLVTLRDAMGNIISSLQDDDVGVLKMEDFIVLATVRKAPDGDLQLMPVDDTGLRYQVSALSSTRQFAITLVPLSPGELLYQVLLCRQECCEDEFCTILARCKVGNSCQDLECCTALNTHEGKSGPYTFKTSEMYHGTMSTSSRVVGIDYHVEDHGVIAGQIVPF